MSTASEIRRLAKKFSVLKKSEAQRSTIKEKIRGESKISPENVAALKKELLEINKDKLRRRMAPFVDLNLLAFDETVNPDEYDEAVSHIERAIKNVKSPYQELIKKSGVDYYDIAEEVYLMSRENVVPGNTIPIESLVLAIEAVTEGVGKLGLEELKRKRPFFF